MYVLTFIKELQDNLKVSKASDYKQKNELKLREASMHITHITQIFGYTNKIDNIEIKCSVLFRVPLKNIMKNTFIISVKG